MDKDKRFTGQPVLSQILDLIPSSLISKSCKKYQANRYYKALPLRVHLISLLYGVFNYCNGLRELCEGMLGCEGKLQHSLYQFLVDGFSHRFALGVHVQFFVDMSYMRADGVNRNKAF